MTELKDLEQSIASLSARVDHLQRSIEDVRRLVGPFGVAFPDGSMLVQTLYGTKYFIDPTDDIMAPQLVVYRQWEPDISKFVFNSVNEETVFVDVGANFGYFSVLAASKIGSGGRGHVISVEPNPKMVALLKRNLRINWSLAPVTVHECAVAKDDGFMQFMVPSGRAANAGLSRSDQEVESGDQRFIVQTRSLQTIIGSRRIDLMKIDVEGYEMSVLETIGPVLEASPALVILMEWSPAQMKSAGFGLDGFLQLLTRHQLSAHRIPSVLTRDPQQLANSQLTPENLAATAYDNIMLMRMTT